MGPSPAEWQESAGEELAGRRGHSSEIVQRESRKMRLQDDHRSQIKKGGDRDFLESTQPLG